MDLQRQDLDAAASAGIIDSGQADALWRFLHAHNNAVASFRVTHILYYLGGLVAIGAMTLFMTLGWERFGGAGIFAIALLYGGAGTALAHHLQFKKQLAIPAGIIATLVIAVTPLAIYGLQQWMGWWQTAHPYRDYHILIDARWLAMECGTLAVASLMLWRFRLGFLVMPVALTLWYMSMDLAPAIAGSEHAPELLRKQISLMTGLLMIVTALFIELRTRSRQDFAFWLYLWGVIAFWGALSMFSADSEWQKFGYLCINLVMIACGALLSRRVFVVFGAFGVCGYTGYLAYHVFKDSMLFPFALTAVGLGVIYLGILWQRHEERITRGLQAGLPQGWREFLARRS